MQPLIALSLSSLLNQQLIGGDPWIWRASIVFVYTALYTAKTRWLDPHPPQCLPCVGIHSNGVGAHRGLCSKRPMCTTAELNRNSWSERSSKDEYVCLLALSAVRLPVRAPRPLHSAWPRLSGLFECHPPMFPLPALSCLRGLPAGVVSSIPKPAPLIVATPWETLA